MTDLCAKSQFLIEQELIEQSQLHSISLNARITHGGCNVSVTEYSTAVLQYCCVTALQCYSTAVLLCCCVAVLQCYSTGLQVL